VIVPPNSDIQPLNCTLLLERFGSQNQFSMLLLWEPCDYVGGTCRCSTPAELLRYGDPRPTIHSSSCEEDSSQRILGCSRHMYGLCDFSRDTADRAVFIDLS
jgi:hypothetical protein